MADLAKRLERLYARMNRREYVHPDPLEFLYRYDDARDREIVGLVASSLAYGRVAQILRSVALALGRLGDRPADFVAGSSPSRLRRAFRGFRHRFTTGDELARLLAGARGIMKRHGSLGAFFSDVTADATRDRDGTVMPTLAAFARELRSCGRLGDCHLVPRVERGSACKRLNLYLRWMVRRDEVDPGGWDAGLRSMLVVPLDTHMFRICRALGFTSRAQASGAAALEATAGFRALSPEDPVRYDFALTRLGIRADADVDDFLAECDATEAA